MFARIVTIPLKADSRSQLAKVIETKVIPLLRTNKGFLDVIQLISADGKMAFGISFWDSKESAEAYHRSGFTQVMNPLESVSAGSATVQLCEVTNSTTHKIAAAAGA
jgi:hypothetical protein